MTLRRRLAAWYGAVLALVLAVALWLAYDLHTEAHDSDVDVALAAMVSRAQTEIDVQLRDGVPMGALDLSGVHAAIDEPYAVWFVADGRAVASAGLVSDLAFTDAAVTELPAGSHTQWTVDGRVRSSVLPIGIGSIVASADLAVIDAANGELRTAFVILGLMAVGIGVAVFSVVAGVALRPVATLTETASEIAETRDFTRRVGIHGDPHDELVALASTFDDMLVSLDGAYRQQQRFLGDVSHELRTPLTTIRGSAELLERGALSPDEAHVAATRIAREAARVSRLVGELLTLARAEAAEAFAPRPLHLDEVVMEAFEELRVVAGPRLRVRWIEPAQVSGERDRLKQLVIALVDNALSYTPEPGGVDISLSDDGRDAVLRVEDEGIGIDEADLPRVFDRFYRGAAARRVNGGGSGLGLAITKWIVERHGGTIRLQRAESRGTLATVRLPLLQQPAAPAREGEPAAAPSSR
ncbi:MAG TPA: HAMP domain-containing sensor histidine kinase [Candidatus Acidoferrales bacterium]|nr:HAMP domain-containing sensor histidine kinase [Candidatus Acidoferrales bacterium]